MSPVLPIGSDEPQSRAALRRARRVLIKAGTSVVANEDGRPVSEEKLDTLCIPFWPKACLPKLTNFSH